MQDGVQSIRKLDLGVQNNAGLLQHVSVPKMPGSAHETVMATTQWSLSLRHGCPIIESHCENKQQDTVMQRKHNQHGTSNETKAPGTVRHGRTDHE
jgi:hypothetical protein